MSGLLVLLLGLPPAAAGQSSASLKDTVSLDGKLYHVQGLGLDDDHFWVTSVDTANHRGYLHMVRRAGVR